jgi:hypothetical protein
MLFISNTRLFKYNRLKIILTIKTHYCAMAIIKISEVPGSIKRKDFNILRPNKNHDLLSDIHFLNAFSWVK